MLNVDVDILSFWCGVEHIYLLKYESICIFSYVQCRSHC